MNKFFAAFSFVFLLTFASAQPASALTFVTVVSALAGNPLPVSLYDSDSNPIPNGGITWSLSSGGALPSTLTVVPTGTNGFTFNSTVTGAFSVKATVGAASGSVLLNFTGIKFTSP